jgi:hypothetical protein
MSMELDVAHRRYLNDCLSYCESLGDHCSAEECIPGDVQVRKTNFSPF